MNWHDKVYQLHNKSEISGLLRKLIENFPHSKNQAASEAFLINILKHEKLKIDDATISVFMKNSTPEILKNLFESQEIKPTTKRLLAAVESNNVAAVTAMLDLGADVSKGNPLLSALEKGNSEIASLLLEKGADANVVNESGFSALYLAYSDNNLPIIEALLKHGADINQVNSDGKTPIMDVLSNENINIDILKFFIAKGADLEIRDEFGEGSLPISVAIQSGSIDVIQALLSAMNPELLNAERESLIKEAVAAGHGEIAELLTSKPALRSSTSYIAEALNISLHSPAPTSPTVDAVDTTKNQTIAAGKKPEVEKPEVEKPEEKKQRKDDPLYMPSRNN